ncbi:hypothetical protein ACFZDG_31010 [Kitasatospora xanthocidica]|uniref:hypothetical protein n=1 Tax=Kitasatospora xanthocidica TaxID=83382 RepID=UPI0036DFD136
MTATAASGVPLPPPHPPAPPIVEPAQASPEGGTKGPGTVASAPPGALAQILAPVAPARRDEPLGTTTALAQTPDRPDRKDGPDTAAGRDGGAAQNAAQGGERDGAISALVRALADRLRRTGTTTNIKRQHSITENRVSGNSATTTNTNKADRQAKHEHSTQHRSQRDAKTADLNNKTSQHQHQGRDQRDVKKNDATDAKNHANRDHRSKADTDAKSADTKTAKADTSSASRTGKDSRDHADRKTSDTKAAKDDKSARTGSDDKDHRDTKSSKASTSKDSPAKAPGGGSKPDTPPADGTKAPKTPGPDGPPGKAAPTGPDGKAAPEKSKADRKDPARDGAGDTKPGPKSADAPKSAPAPFLGAGGMKDKGGLDGKFGGTRTAGTGKARREPPKTTPPPPVRPTGATDGAKTPPPPLTPPAPDGPKPTAPPTPPAKAPAGPGNGPAPERKEPAPVPTAKTPGPRKPDSPPMQPVRKSTADLTKNPPTGGPAPATSRPTMPPRSAVGATAPAGQAGRPAAEPVTVREVTPHEVAFNGMRRLSRLEVRTLCQFEKRMEAKVAVLARVAEDSKTAREHAVAHALRAQRLAEEAKTVRGGVALVNKLRRLAEQAQKLRLDAELAERHAVRGAEAVKALASNARTRHGGIYRAVQDSPLTTPAERQFYRDQQGG